MSKLASITLEPAGLSSFPQPISFGLPLPKGLVKDAQKLVLSFRGELIPFQCTPLLYWPDGSLKWVLCDFVAKDKGDYHLALGAKAKAPVVEGLKVKESPLASLVENGPFLFEILSHNPWPKALYYEGQALFPSLGKWALLSAQNNLADFVVDRARLEAKGPVRLTIVLKGHIISKRDALKLWFYERLSFFAGLPLIKVEMTILNPRRAKHKGGFWDLGDPGSQYFKDLSLLIPCPGFQ